MSIEKCSLTKKAWLGVVDANPHFGIAHLAHIVHEFCAFAVTHWALDALACGCFSGEKGAVALLVVSFSLEFCPNPVLILNIVCRKLPWPERPAVFSRCSHCYFLSSILRNSRWGFQALPISLLGLPPWKAGGGINKHQHLKVKNALFYSQEP